MAAWPKLILAKMSTIVYDGGRSRKVKKMSLSKKETCQRDRGPGWPKLISANFITNGSY